MKTAKPSHQDAYDGEIYATQMDLDADNGDQSGFDGALSDAEDDDGYENE